MRPSPCLTVDGAACNERDLARGNRRLGCMSFLYLQALRAEGRSPYGVLVMHALVGAWFDHHQEAPFTDCGGSGRQGTPALAACSGAVASLSSLPLLPPPKVLVLSCSAPSSHHLTARHGLSVVHLSLSLLILHTSRAACSLLVFHLDRPFATSLFQFTENRPSGTRKTTTTDTVVDTSPETARVLSPRRTRRLPSTNFAQFPCSRLAWLTRVIFNLRQSSPSGFQEIDRRLSSIPSSALLGVGRNNTRNVEAARPQRTLSGPHSVSRHPLQAHPISSFGPKPLRSQATVSAAAVTAIHFD
ncbi:hypothetical protein TOPH_00103 [Tolypocladium ophioglossoides CBS 100239]|uniref:Uncharacterized protein n=1 Tax=Tolypocladium ophioglossoides (strain CBS 100239) TaxID=1163406 RepID=A0A0L0NM54_TOLOC|nr:hypothetical protein TOPH_00103 [Tolypocladium ophioglossoides CBS 100239]